MECLAGIAKDFAKDTVIGAGNQLRYACCFNKFVEDLEEERDNLIARRDGVEDRVEQAKKQTKKPAEVMDKWLKGANSDIDKVNELLQKARTKKSCLPYCPNWFCRYYLGRKLANKKVDVERRTREGDPYVALERNATLPPGITTLDSEKCMNFESRQSTYEQLMKAVKDEEVSLIGLYGMGGCGKTTLAAEVGNKAKAENLFDKVLFVPVSSVVEIRRIQDKIASSLSYEFPPSENEESERAKRLHMRLSREKKILVIMDDVWQKLNFGAIGIPYSTEDPKGCCKVLITTRSEYVCKAMDCHRNIHLPILTNDEGWSLFKRKANISEQDTLKDLARKVSDECKGLPVAIAAVASTLKGKEEVAWKAALTRLRSSIPVNIDKGLQDPYKCLQLSFDNLDSPEAKSLLFFCSVFPEDYEIPVDGITRFAIGLGIVGEIQTYETTRNEVSTAKNKLVSSCLLLDVDNGKGVKMHDLVRDVAQWIAKNQNKAILCTFKNDGVTNLEEHNSSVRYLYCEEFPNELDCSNLEFLRMTTKLEVSDEVFKRMGKLRVLYLSNFKKRRPLSTMSFRSLTNLRYLELYKWELSDFSFLGGMQKLEGLTMCFCSFRELPDDAVVTQLKKMKLFDLYECTLERKNYEVITKLPWLDELYIVDDSPEWDVYDGNTAEFFNKISVPQTLQRHMIKFGTRFSGFPVVDEIFSSNCKALCLSCFCTSNTTFQSLVKKSNVLCVANIQGGSKSIIPGTFQTEGGDMNHLIKLWISDSEEIEYLVDTSSKHLSEVGTVFFKLVELRIQNMKHVKALWHGHLPPNGDFHKLEMLVLSDCQELAYLFTPNLLQLESNQSEYLPEITSVPSTPLVNCNLGSSFNLSCLKSLTLESCPKLLGSLFSASFNLSCLTNLTVKSCPKLASLFSASTAQTLTSLEYLSIEDCQGLEHIILNASENLNGKIVEDEPVTQSDTSVLSRLQKLNIRKCDSLQYAFPISFVGCLAKLKFMTIADTPNLKYIFGESDKEADRPCHEQQKLELPVLEVLSLSHIPKIIGIYPGNPYVMCPSLRRLWLEIWEYVDFSTINCSTSTPSSEDRQYQDYITIKVSSTETLHPAQSLPKHLQWFNILFMRNMRVIELKGIEKVKYLFTLSNTSSMMLEFLRIKECPGLKHIIDIGDDCGKKDWDDVFPNLKELLVQDCGQLEYMFGQHPLDHQNYKVIHIHFSVLEELYLSNLPNFNSICPARSVAITWPSLKNFNIDGCSQFINSSISDLMVSLDSRELASTTNKDISGIHKHFLTLETLSIKNSKLESIFSLGGHKIVGQRVNLKLEDVNLESMPQMMYICVGSENSFSFENLQKLLIKGCEKLKVMFPTSIWKCLPQLKWLQISECNELEQIIEDDMENEKSPSHPQPCFPKLGIIFVHQCHKLKRLFCASASNDLPNIEAIIISGASELEEIIRCEQGKVKFPNLKILVFMHLSSLRQGTELETVMHRVVHKCPKLPLDPTATPNELQKGFYELDLELEHIEKLELNELLHLIIERDEVSTTRDGKVGNSLEKAIVDPESQTVSELPSSQNEGKSEKEIIEEVPNSTVPATIASTNSKQIERPSPSSLEIPPHETHSHSIKDIAKESFQEKAMKVTLSADAEGASLADSIVACIEARDEKMLPQDSQVVVPHDESTISHSDNPIESQRSSYPHTGKKSEKEIIEKVSSSKAPVTTTLTDSELIERPSLSSLDIPQHKTNSLMLVDTQPMSESCLTNLQKPLGEAESTIEIHVNFVDQESIRERGFLDKEFVTEETISIENREKESIQEGPAFEKDSLGGIAPNHNEFNGGEILIQDSQVVEEDNKPNEEGTSLANKDGGIGVVSNDRSEIHQGSDRSQTLIIAKLGECKRFVHLDDGQIALLAEAISVYPHLWNVCEEFSGRFQAWMLKTLADILLFLRNESLISVTPHRLKDFQRLCDEAARFGFERSWIDEMRQRVMDKDSEVDLAQAQISELLKRHDQLTWELVEIKGELNRLNDFVAARKKCFDFL